MCALIAATALVLAGAGAGSEAVQAEPFRHYPWCLDYNGDESQETNCGFSTWQQCMATASGAGGICYANPWYFATLPPAPATPPPHRRAR